MNTAAIKSFRTGVQPIDRALGVIKREYLDHFTGYVTVPGVIGVLFIILVIVSLLTGNDVHIAMNDMSVREMNEFEEVRGNAIAMDYLATASLFGVSVPLLMTIPFVLLFGLLSTLFDDRRDKSILFWRSMPVSDVQEVLLKLFTVVLVGPIGIILLTIVYQIIMSLVLGVVLAINTPASMFDLLLNASFFREFFGGSIIYLAYVLNALPVIGYLVAVSAFAPKTPLLLAGLPIAVVTAFEAILFKTSNFIEAFVNAVAFHDGPGGVLRNFDTDYGREFGRRFSDIEDFDIPLQIIGPATDLLAAVVTRTEFFVGLVIAAAFIAAAIWKRGKAI